MIKKKYTSLLTFFILTASVSFAQRPAHATCATEDDFRERAAADPSLLQKRKDFDRSVAEYNERRRSNAGITSVPRIIPIVFHVIHERGPENISKDQIIDQVRILNEDYRRLNPDTNNTPVPFRPLGADCNIEFRLAQIDPNGHCTDGITRSESYLSDACIPRNAVKALDYWDSNKYLNIWVVKAIDPQGQTGVTVLGYAQFPFGTAATDGVVIRSEYIGSIGTAAGPGDMGRVATHEIGHWLNLYHIWGDDNGACTGSDAVADTPNEADQAANCPAFPVIDACATVTTTGNAGDPVNGSMFMNYMDYSDGSCQNIFTMGQLARMDASLAGPRSTNVSASNLIATGTDGTPAVPCAPIAGFFPAFDHICSGDSVQFIANSFNADTIQYSWSFPSGNPSSSALKNPFVTYSSPGQYGATLTASNAQGSDSITLSSLITVSGPATYTGSYVDSFETAGSFPDADGYILNDAGNTWQRITTTGYSGTACIKMLNYNTGQTGLVDSWVTPSINLSGYTSSVLTFQMSYARKDISKTDVLRIYISTTCGKLWTLRRTLSGAQLSTNPNVSGAFTPSSQSQWGLITVSNISQVNNKPNVRFKFEFTSGGDNNLFIDDVNLTSTQISSVIEEAAIAALNFDIYPNPSSEAFNISFETPVFAKTEVKITDLLGRDIKTVVQEQLGSGPHEYSVNAREFSKGIYLVRLKAGETTTVRKLVIE